QPKSAPTTAQTLAERLTQRQASPFAAKETHARTDSPTSRVPASVDHAAPREAKSETPIVVRSEANSLEPSPQADAPAITLNIRDAARVSESVEPSVPRASDSKSPATSQDSPVKEDGLLADLVEAQRRLQQASSRAEPAVAAEMVEPKPTPSEIQVSANVPRSQTEASVEKREPETSTKASPSVIANAPSEIAEPVEPDKPAQAIASKTPSVAPATIDARSEPQVPQPSTFVSTQPQPTLRVAQQPNQAAPAAPSGGRPSTLPAQRLPQPPVIQTQPRVLVPQAPQAVPSRPQPAVAQPGPVLGASSSGTSGNAPADAQDNASKMGPFEVIDESGELTVIVRRSKLLRTKVDIYRTAVVDP
ncbi:MAG: hypothetical protein D6741_20130, partial [Planctomycetota bacterium]